MAVGPSKLVVAVALDRWSPLAGAIYSKKRRGDRESGREGRWSPLAGGRLYRVHCSLTDSMVGTFVYQVLNFGLSSCTLVYKVALWSIKLHFDLSCCILVYRVAFSFSDQVAFWSIKLYFGLSSCI